MLMVAERFEADSYSSVAVAPVRTGVPIARCSGTSTLGKPSAKVPASLLERRGGDLGII